MRPTFTAPDLMPVLTRGKHRNLRRGACFMEMVSFLAGQRWSDHPGCTHPLLAEMARLVNDNVTDQLRQQLLPMIPSVIGLTSDDLHVDVAIASRSAMAALPIAAEPAQHVLATAVLTCERVLAGLDGRDPETLRSPSREALNQVPEAETWARSFSSKRTVPAGTFRAQTAPHILNIAVQSIAWACAPDVEQRLIDLLAATIADCRELIVTGAAAEHTPPVEPPSGPDSFVRCPPIVQ